MHVARSAELAIIALSNVCFLIIQIILVLRSFKLYHVLKS